MHVWVARYLGAEDVGCVRETIDAGGIGRAERDTIASFCFRCLVLVRRFCTR